jgi:periplasmic protein TonB
VRYPSEALNKGIEGNVVVEVSVNESGTVNDARVLSGPEELRSAALQSVLQWHFANDAHAALKTQTTITFDLAAQRSAPGKGSRVPPPPPPPPPSSQTVERILYAVPDDLKQKIESRITLREGDQLSGNTVADLHNTIASIDEHLRMVIQTPMNAKGANVIFMLDTQADAAAEPQGAPTTQPRVIRVGGTVQAFNLIDKVPPVYPQDAKMARIQGVVRFTATIDKTGHVTSLQLISGHPLLVNAARDAVAQWVYKPTLLNGNPVDVTTQIDVNFTLAP